MLYLGADHRGFATKEKIKIYLGEQSIIYEDIGALTLDPGDDWTAYGELLAHKIMEGPDNHKGIACCGSGAGMSIALNRFRGIRAGVSTDPAMTKAQREQDNINVLVIPTNFIVPQAVMGSVDTFLHTDFLQEERYIRRVKEVDL